MRKEPEAASAPGEAAAVVEEAPKAAVKPSAARSAGPRLTDVMALEEPARTDALEKAVQSGASFRLRSKSGEEVRCLYGEHALTVTGEPREFMAAHAIHLLWTVPNAVEEV